MNWSKLAKGGVITLLIGGASYSVSQSDVVKNFAADTGLTKEQAEQYVSNVSEDDLVSFEKLGSGLIAEGQDLLTAAAEVDCANNTYEWESPTLSCYQGITQVQQIGRDTSALGQAYKKLTSDSASRTDISETIRLIDQLNSDYHLEIITALLSQADIDEGMRTNSYNKAILKAALESN